MSLECFYLFIYLFNIYTNLTCLQYEAAAFNGLQWNTVWAKLIAGLGPKSPMFDPVLLLKRNKKK